MQTSMPIPPVAQMYEHFEGKFINFIQFKYEMNIYSFNINEIVSEVFVDIKYLLFIHSI